MKSLFALALFSALVQPAFAQATFSPAKPRATDPSSALVGTWNVLVVGGADRGGVTLGTDGVPTYWSFNRRTAEMLTVVNGVVNRGGACPYELSAIDRTARTATLRIRCPGTTDPQLLATLVKFTRDYRAAEFVAQPAPGAPETALGNTTVLAIVQESRR